MPPGCQAQPTKHFFKSLGQPNGQREGYADKSKDPNRHETNRDKGTSVSNNRVKRCLSHLKTTDR